MKGGSRKKVESFRMRLKRGILIPALAAVFLAAGMAGGTVAWMIAGTDEVVNTFKPVEVTDEIEEVFDNQIKENVKIRNTGDIAAYVRVVLVPAWVDADGNIAAQKPDEGDYEIDINETDWFSVATDGITFWYCKTNVEADEESPVLIKSCRPLDSEHGMDGSPLHFQLKVISSSIQAEPDRAVHEAWPAVKVSDGELVLVTSGVGN